MNNNNSFTTIILHDIRKRLKLSCNEYCIADLIDWQMDETGWCELSREEIAQLVGLSKQATVKILDRLVKDALLYKNEQTKKLCTTAIWKDNFVNDKNAQIINSEQGLTSVKNSPTFIQLWRPARPFTPFTD